MKKFGFTMAETLITLAIIAFIATIMLPALQKAQPNKELIMFRKSYYLAARIITELINDEDFYPDRENESDSGFSNISISDLIGHEARYHGETFGGTGTNYPGNQKLCGLFSTRLNLIGEVSCTDTDTPDTFHYTTTDNMRWHIPISDFGSPSNIVIDVNGDRPNNCVRGENTTSSGGWAVCDGLTPDRFILTVDRYGKISIPDPVAQEYLTTRFTTRTYEETVKRMIKQGKLPEGSK